VIKVSLLGVAMLFGCGDGGRPVALASGAPTEITAACSLAGQRCSRCHSIDRVERAHISQPEAWREYVRRMRLMPGSGIPPEEELAIVQCLVFRTSGSAGLAALGTP
jgi:hypothetical protein